MAWPGILLHLLISSLKIRFCEQSVFAKSPLSIKINADKKINCHNNSYSGQRSLKHLLSR